MSDTAIQFVTLDNDNTVALFVDSTEGTRVFLDVNDLCLLMGEYVIQQHAVALAANDTSMLAEVAGAAHIVNGIKNSADTLLLEVAFSRS